MPIILALIPVFFPILYFFMYRSKDRALNNHVYPRIHYPEVYILKGGYSQYFSDSPNLCEPIGYVRMDDPHYARDCKEDLDHFRKAAERTMWST